MTQAHLAMRHLKLEEHTPHHIHDFHNPELFPKKNKVSRYLGEGLYTLTTSNFQWPDGVTFSTMRQVRTDVLIGAMR